MDRQTKVYILGAGCSVCGGYPMANKVTDQLSTFSKEVLTRENTTELRRCVDQTCSLLKECNVSTIDQLSKRLYPDNRKAILEAKIAMATLFLSIEERAVVEALPFYAEFFEELFHYGTSSNLEERAFASPCRVLSFNYDRLFEQTFIEWAKQ
jgi:hypothetical protein